MNLKARLVMLKKTMSGDLRNALKARGIHAAPSEISLALGGCLDGRKGREIRESAVEIIAGWESESYDKRAGA